MTTSRRRISIATALGLALVIAAVAWLVIPALTRARPASADDGKGTAAGDWKAQAQVALDRATVLLKSRQKAGLFEMKGQPEPGITALATTALLRNPALKGAEREALTRPGLEFLASLAKPDGGIYGEGLANYVTSASVCAFVASGDPKYRPLIENARAFLVKIQIDDGENVATSDVSYGGIGYTGENRPDLSNMNLWMEGTRAAGLKPGDDAYKKAILFLSRVQNNSETNTVPFEAKDNGKPVTYVSGNDGGAFYRPGESKPGFIELPDGKRVLRSYGSMTYCLLKCYLLAGLPKDDPRLAKAAKWISEHYTLEENPGFDTKQNPNAGYQGLYYYYLALAQALTALGDDVVTDAKGTKHVWREELVAALASRQKPDGSWTNDTDRWWEGDPDLVSAYAMQALEACLQKTP